MKKILSLLALLSVATLGRAGNVTTYPNVSSVTDADILWDWQGGAQQNATALQFKTYLLGGGTMSIGSGKVVTISNTLTFTGTDSSTVAFGAGGTVLYASAIGSSIQAYNANLANFAALSHPGSGTLVLASDSSGNFSWVAQSGSSSITIGSNATGYLSFSSNVLNFANPVNGASGLVVLDNTGAIVMGLLGNYINHSGGVQGYSGGTLVIGASKTATISNTLTFTGTDGSTLAIGTGGTLGTNAYTSTAYAPLASPTFTGTPAAPTASPGTNTTQLATTAFVLANGGGYTADTIQSSNFTAAKGITYQVNTTSAAITAQTVTTPSVGDWFNLQDAELTWATHNVTIHYNGTDKINGGTSDYVASVVGNKLHCTYISSGYGWSIK